MQAELATAAGARPVSAWTLITGGSFGWVAGFGVDLLRLGAHRARQTFAARSGPPGSAARGWPCPGACGAGPR